MNSCVDPHLRELFVHLRQAVDPIEELVVWPSTTPVQQSRPEPRQPQPSVSPPTNLKLAFSMKGA
jgi:hypothetical protein